MKEFILAVLLTLFWSFSIAQNIDNTAYPYDPATQPQKGIVAGEIIERHFSESKIYPGTERPYWIYIPVAYTSERPACLYVCMDEIQYNAPTVFDNLIASGEMPLTIGIFVGSGKVTNDKNETLRFNRSNEFDKTDDTFVRFLLEELLPDAEKQKTKDGHIIRFSKDPNDRAIAGASSGAICAFTAAWQHPDEFSRVFSAIGTYVAMRGGNEYPALIRKTEPKPIRIFLEDGINDTWNPLFGNWYEANLLMESALNFAGYEVEHNWGRGGHDGIHATHIFPDAMRWIWKGYPAKVQKGNSLNNMLSTILLKDADWKEIDLPVSPSSELFTDEAGNIIFQTQEGTVYKIDSTKQIISKTIFPVNEKLIGTNGNKFFIVNSKGTIAEINIDYKKRIIAKGILNAKQILVTFEKDIYITQETTGKENKLWLIKPDGTKRVVNSQPHLGSNIAIYPNHKLLMQTEKNSQWIYSHVIDSERYIINSQRFYWLHNTDNFDFTENGNITFDKNGNLYVASIMGVQVCDQNGRVRAILNIPTGRISSVMFGGKNYDILYVVSNGKVYSRKMNVFGSQSWMPTIEIISQGGG